MVEKILRTIATILAIIGGLIGFYLYSQDTSLTIIFAGVLTSLSLHVVTFENMVTKEYLEQRIAELKAIMATKEDIKDMATKEDLEQAMVKVKSYLRLIVEYVSGNSAILVDFLSSRGIIEDRDARILKTMFATHREITLAAINPLRLSKKEKEAILRIMDLPLEEITEEDCDIAYEALKRNMLEGSIEAARMLAILTWLRAYIKYGRKKEGKEKQEG